jgi:hypothetical protein
MHRVRDAVHHSMKQGTLLNLPHHRKPLKVKHIEFKSKPNFICAPGSVFKGNTCVKCPVGTYYNMTTGSCESCPIGYYQPLEGSIICLSCAPGTSTRRTHAKNVRECRRKSTVIYPVQRVSIQNSFCNSSLTYAFLSHIPYAL